MRWSLAFFWFGRGVACMFVGGLALGPALTWLDPSGPDSLFARLVGGLIVGVVGGLWAAFLNLLLGLGAYALLAILGWAFLAQRFPGLERSPRRAGLSLLVYCALLSSVILVLLGGFDMEAACFSSALLFCTLIPPRFLVERLRPGAFAA